MKYLLVILRSSLQSAELIAWTKRCGKFSNDFSLWKEWVCEMEETFVATSDDFDDIVLDDLEDDKVDADDIKLDSRSEDNTDDFDSFPDVGIDLKLWLLIAILWWNFGFFFLNFIQ